MHKVFYTKYANSVNIETVLYGMIKRQQKESYLVKIMAHRSPTSPFIIPDNNLYPLSIFSDTEHSFIL